MRHSLSFILLASCALPAVAAAAESPLFPAPVNPSFSEASFKEDRTRIVGGFGVTPTVTVGLSHTDNVYFNDTSKDSDTIAELDAALNVASIWRTHELKATALLNVQRFADHSSENTVDGGVIGSGRFDFSPYSSLTGEVTALRGHESRSLRALAFTTDEPIAYDNTAVRLAYNAQGNRLKYYGGFIFRKLDYSDADLVGGGIADMDYRDSKLNQLDGRVDYRVTDATSAFVYVQANSVRFDSKTINRDSDGYAVRVGAAFYMSELLTGEFQVGYMNQDYKNSAFRSVNGASYYANLHYSPTRLTTLIFKAQRSIEEAPAVNASGYFLNSGQVLLKHELTRRLNLGVGLETTKYEYNAIDRDNTRNGIYLGAQYELTRKLSVEVSLRNLKFKSSGADALSDPEYTENLIGVSLKANF